MPQPHAPHRDLFRGSLEVLLLSVLTDGPRHGYGIQKQLRLTTNQPLTPGTLYPLLHRFEADGLIRADWDRTTPRPRKVYALTEAGRARLRRAAAEWQATIARLQAQVLPAVRRIAKASNSTSS